MTDDSPGVDGTFALGFVSVIAAGLASAIVIVWALLGDPPTPIWYLAMTMWIAGAVMLAHGSDGR